MASQPVYHTIREQIADQIRTDVLSGRLPEGTSLREQTLAKQYGVSRAPIRDALLQLTQEGLLVAKPNCGVKVGSTDPGSNIQPLIIDLRRRIEVFALRSVFIKFSATDIDCLDKAVERLRVACQKEDIADIVRQDMAFHRFIIEATGNADLLATWLPIVSRMMLHCTRHHDWMDSHREHAAIVDAIRRRDKRGAVRALAANIQ